MPQKTSRTAYKQPKYHKAKAAKNEATDINENKTSISKNAFS